MKLRYKNKNNKPTIQDVLFGQCFRYNDKVYLLTRERESRSVLAINVETGYCSKLCLSVNVEPLDTELVIF